MFLIWMMRCLVVTQRNIIVQMLVAREAIDTQRVFRPSLEMEMRMI